MESLIDGFVECKQISEVQFECEWLINYLDLQNYKPFYFSPRIYPAGQHPYRVILQIKTRNFLKVNGHKYFDLHLETLLFETKNNSFHDMTDMDFLKIGPRNTMLILTIEATLLSLDKEIYTFKKSEWNTFDENCFEILTFQKSQWTKKSFNKFKKGLIIKINISTVDLNIEVPDYSRIMKTYPSQLNKDMTTLYSKGILDDLTICVEDVKFPVHKGVLVTRSTVFKKMLEHDCMEISTNCITLSDCSAYSFDMFLRYLYTGEIKDDSLESALCLYTLSFKYDVPCLGEECDGIIKDRLRFDDLDNICKYVCSVLQVSDRHGNGKLRKISFDFIVSNFSKVGKTGEWEELMKNNCELASEVLVLMTESMK